MAMFHCPGDADIGQAQYLVFLCAVVWLGITVLAQSRHAIDLVLVGRTGQVLAIPQQEYRIGLQALGAVVGQLLEAALRVRQVRININYS